MSNVPITDTRVITVDSSTGADTVVVVVVVCSTWIGSEETKTTSSSERYVKVVCLACARKRRDPKIDPPPRSKAAFSGSLWAQQLSGHDVLVHSRTECQSSRTNLLPTCLRRLQARWGRKRKAISLPFGTPRKDCLKICPRHKETDSRHAFLSFSALASVCNGSRVRRSSRLIESERALIEAAKNKAPPRFQVEDR